MADEKEKSVGAIWIKEGAKGKFMSIQIEVEGVKHSFVGFKNGFKKEDKHPDYQIFEAKKKTNSTSSSDVLPNNPVKNDSDLPF